jgi:hypothetical protein
MIGQVKSANFADQYMLDLFKCFLILRPAIIVCFTTYTTLLSLHRANFTLSKLRASKRIEIERDEQALKNEGQRGKTPGGGTFSPRNADFW